VRGLLHEFPLHPADESQTQEQREAPAHPGEAHLSTNAQRRGVAAVHDDRDAVEVLDDREGRLAAEDDEIVRLAPQQLRHRPLHLAHRAARLQRLLQAAADEREAQAPLGRSGEPKDDEIFDVAIQGLDRVLRELRAGGERDVRDLVTLAEAAEELVMAEIAARQRVRDLGGDVEDPHRLRDLRASSRPRLDGPERRWQGSGAVAARRGTRRGTYT
jgi:hypothetical protein